jgi:hypothetical protein
MAGKEMRRRVTSTTSPSTSHDRRGRGSHNNMMIHWRAYRDRQHQLYWGREDTQESRWSKPGAGSSVLVDDFPEDEVLKNWRAHRCALYGDELYFINLLTGERSWTRPAGFTGMPAGEPQDDDHANGPFVEYKDNLSCYYYNPRTKLSTRTKPSDASLIIPEEVAFPARAVEEGEDETNPVAAAAAAAAAESASSSSDEDDDDTPDPAETAFDDMLTKKQVNHLSRWQNWVGKLQGEPAFAALPADKRRARFEQFVKAQVVAREKSRSVVVAKAKDLLDRLSAEDGGDKAWATQLFPADVKQALEALEPAEKQALFSLYKKR